MHRRCAWCGRALDPTPPAPHDGELITHGICESCRDTFLLDVGTPLQDFIDTLGAPVLIVEDDTVAVAANQRALELAGKDLEALKGQRLGDVFECANAKLPEGCGRTVHCSGCTIRNSVTHTHDTHEPCLRVPASLKQGPVEEPNPVDLYITTEWVAGKVLLKIEKV